MKKITPQTKDITTQNIHQIAQLFPQVITEKEDANGNTVKAIDFELLKQHLSTAIVEGADERYRLDWPGKRASILKANTPITTTLKPDRESSVNFDTTENVYIEGDNFEVLKILQESYLGKIKMIYIDPPYNTGNDFVYKDDFKVSRDEYEDELGLEDEEGGKLFKNTDTNGRFHSDWLSMMYKRLLVARDLLTDDGVIFMSIDDNEVHNLRKMADEVFGEENFEGHIHWRRRHNQPNDKTKLIGLVAEHILVYAKSSEALKKNGVGKLPLTGSFSNPDNDSRGDWATKPWKVGSDQSGSSYRITTPTGITFDEEWMGEENTFKSLLVDNRIIFTREGNGIPRKKYFKFEREEEGQCATNWWSHELFGHNQEGNNELTGLFDGNKNLFSNPKNTKLLGNLIQLGNLKEGSIILDFFSGSASTAHSVFLSNFSDSINSKFIMVQIPEDLQENLKSSDSKTKKQLESSINFLKSIGKKPFLTELGKERIRRAGKKILEENAEKLKERKTPLDVGFRVYKTAPSILKHVAKHPTKVSQTEMFKDEDNIKENATDEDILTSVILDFGLTLDNAIATKQVAGATIFMVDDNALVACFSKNIDMQVVEAMAQLQPLRAVFRDACFKDDKDLINTVESRFKQLAPNTKVHVI